MLKDPRVQAILAAPPARRCAVEGRYPGLLDDGCSARAEMRPSRPSSWHA